MSHHIAQHVATHTVKLAGEAIKELAPLRERRNVFLAAAIGFAFGPLGVAIYLKSAKDFFLCLAILLVLSVLLFFGPGEILGWLFSPAYAAWRAHTSNEKLDAASTCTDLVE